MNDVYLNMGLEIKTSIFKDAGKTYGYRVEIHHIGPDDIQEKKQSMYATPEIAFHNMISNLLEDIKTLLDEYK